MTIYRITALVPGYNGMAGGCSDKAGSCLHFIDGTGYTEAVAFIDYAARSGFSVDTVDSIPTEYLQAKLSYCHHREPVPAAHYQPPSPYRVGSAPAVDGEWFATSPLRDAAVDPSPGDYLPPVNAGTANPHGPSVVSVQALSPRSGNPPWVDGARYEPATVHPEPTE